MITKIKLKGKVGQPPKYKSPEELQVMIDNYFNSCPQKPTILGLVLYLGFSDRRSYYDYEARKPFSHILKRARTRIAERYEANLGEPGNHGGSIFALKNLDGWRDVERIEHDYTRPLTLVLAPAKSIEIPATTVKVLPEGGKVPELGE